MGSEPCWDSTNDNVEEMLEHVAEGKAVCIGARLNARHHGRSDLRWDRATDVAAAWSRRWDADREPPTSTYRLKSSTN